MNTLPGAIQVTVRAPAHGAPVPVCRAERAAEAARAPSTGWQAYHTVYPYEYPLLWYINGS